ncbi:MAG: DHHA1 domain-containing protein [Desulfurococcaceae archaeon]
MLETIITHTDIDGVAAASLYLYLRDPVHYKVYFTEPFLLNKTLNKIMNRYSEKLVLIDIGINPLIYQNILGYLKTMRERGTDIEWYDHHVWEDKWINEIKAIGVKLSIDRSTCATGVIAEYVTPLKPILDRVFIDQVVKGVCAGDLWTFDHWLAPYYLRLVRRRDSDEWRKSVLEVIRSGRYWDEKFEEKVAEHVDLELKVLSSNLRYVVRDVDGLRIVIAENIEHLENSFTASYLFGRLDADIVIIASDDGKLSLRSRDFNVRDIALKLGGGGHPHAAGAKIDVPWSTRVFSKLSKKIFLSYVLDKILGILTDRR